MDEEASNSSILLSVALGSDESLEFRSYKELEDWITSFERCISPLHEVRRRDSSLNQSTEWYASKINQVRGALNLGRQKPGSEAEKAHLDTVGGTIKEIITRAGMRPGSPNAKFIEELAKADTVTAGYAIAALTNQPQVEPKSVSAFNGLIEGYLYKNGLLERGAKGRAAAASKSMDALLSQLEKSLSEANEKVSQFRDEAASLLGKTNAQIEDAQKDHEAHLADQRQASYALFQKSEEKLNSIAAAYDAKMALQAPVEYWKAQAASHRKLAIGFGIASGVWVVVSIIGLYFGARWLLGEGSLQSITQGPGVPNVPLWHLGLVVMSVTLVIWVQRILVRILLSHVHLATDGSERVVMARTYIALLRDAKGPKEEDRQLILQTLFRPSATGIVKDDGIPPTVLEWITRLGGGGRAGP